MSGHRKNSQLKSNIQQLTQMISKKSPSLKAGNNINNNTNTYSSGSVTLSAAISDKPTAATTNMKKLASRTIAVEPSQVNENVRTHIRCCMLSLLSSDYFAFQLLSSFILINTHVSLCYSRIRCLTTPFYKLSTGCKSF